MEKRLGDVATNHEVVWRAQRAAAPRRRCVRVAAHEAPLLCSSRRSWPIAPRVGAGRLGAARRRSPSAPSSRPSIARSSSRVARAIVVNDAQGELGVANAQMAGARVERARQPVRRCPGRQGPRRNPTSGAAGPRVRLLPRRPHRAARRAHRRGGQADQVARGRRRTTRAASPAARPSPPTARSSSAPRASPSRRPESRPRATRRSTSPGASRRRTPPSTRRRSPMPRSRAGCSRAPRRSSASRRPVRALRRSPGTANVDARRRTPPSRSRGSAAPGTTRSSRRWSTTRPSSPVSLPSAGSGTPPSSATRLSASRRSRSS